MSTSEGESAESADQKQPSQRRRTQATESSRNTVVGVSLVMLSALSFGISPAMVKLAFLADLNGLSLIAFRCLIGAAVLAVISQAFGERSVGRSSAWRLGLVGATLFGPQMWAYFTALSYMESSVVVAIVYVYPAIVAALVAIGLRRRPGGVEIILLAMALCGVAVVALLDGGTPTSTAGVVLAAVTALGYALYVVVVAPIVNGLPPLVSSCWVLLGSGLSTVAAAMVTGQMQLPGNMAGYGYVAIHGFFIVPIGLAAFYGGLSRLGATRTSIVDTMQPVIAALVGVVVLGEYLSGPQIIGIALVILAVLGLPLTAGRDAKRPRQSASRWRFLQRDSYEL